VNKITKYSKLITTVSLIILTVGLLSAQSAAELYTNGEFEAAKNILVNTVKDNDGTYDNILLFGRLNLYENNFIEAEKWLQKAIELSPEENTPKNLLAETYYRQDQFDKAIPLLRETGKIGKADQLQYLSGKVPNKIDSDGNKWGIEFVQTDPLPIVKMKLNNGEEVYFVIDTGGWTLILDKDYAEEIGLEILGEQEVTFAGDTKGTNYFSVVDKVEMGDLVVKNIPVELNNMVKSFAMLGKPVKGVLGTVFLYHFLFTFDYPGGNLILERKAEENIAKLENSISSEDYHNIPFWMIGNHVMVAHGKVNNSKPLLFWLDTGMAGGGFDCPESVVKEGNIELSDETFTGMTGGGPIEVRSGIVKELSLGGAIENNVMGIFGGFPNEMEYREGFRLGGVVSHGFFRSYKVTFDFSSMQIALERSNH